MNTDFRVSVHIWRHPKFMELGDALGSDGQICLLKLFSFASVNRPDGILHKLSDRTIERSCDFMGEPGTLIATLVELAWLDRNDNGILCIHDWQRHNPWACQAEARSDKARNAAAARWEKENKPKNATSNATSIRRAMPKQDSSNADSNAPILPSPSPSLPIPTNPTDARARSWTPLDFWIGQHKEAKGRAPSSLPPKIDGKDTHDLVCQCFNSVGKSEFEAITRYYFFGDLAERAEATGDIYYRNPGSIQLFVKKFDDIARFYHAYALEQEGGGAHAGVTVGGGRVSPPPRTRPLTPAQEKIAEGDRAIDRYLQKNIIAAAVLPPGQTREER